MTMVSQLGIFRRSPKAPHFLCFFHPLDRSVLQQCPNAPVCFRIRVCGTEEHRVRGLPESQVGVTVSYHTQWVIGNLALLQREIVAKGAKRVAYLGEM